MFIRGLTPFVGRNEFATDLHESARIDSIVAFRSAKERYFRGAKGDCELCLIKTRVGVYDGVDKFV